ncbi:MAG: type I methionyl aminopeptidase [Christensenellaceae bacterium]|jgi:methionyl aminopeptidase|nr:type I methionyl aminopeptidase [Christensenellaceae bacterium]
MIDIKIADQITKMRAAGKLTRETLEFIEKNIKHGVTPKQLDKLAYDYIIHNGGYPSCLGFEGYKYSTCMSVNNTIVHGVPTDEPLKEGDIISVDLCVELNGFNGDSARTYPVGKISKARQKLIDVTKQSFFEGIKNIKDGSTVGDIGAQVQKYVEKHGFSVVRDLCGHGIGKTIHEEPPVPNFGKAGLGPKLHAGMTICVEPMVNAGDCQVIFDKTDGWTVRTKDGSDAAHYENTILITKDGVEILT